MRSCLRSVATRAPLRLAFFATLALVATWRLLGTAHAINVFRDAHVLSHYESIARTTVLRFHEAPLWDPYYCGGMYLLGTPQARFVSPTFLLTLLFGEPEGEALTAFAMLVVGLEGAFRYARTRSASAVASLVAAPVFGLSGIFAFSPHYGWVNFFGFALVPWIAAGTRRALAGHVRGAVLAAAGVAWCTGFGGTYAVPMVALWCAFEIVEALALAVRARDRKRAVDIVRMAVVVASLGAGLAAVRLWPVAETLADAPRVIGGAPGNEYRALARMLFFGLENDTPDGQFFIGALAIPAGIVAIVHRRAIALVAYGGLWAWLGAGYGVFPSLFAATQALPVYGTLRYPERYLILFGLVASTLAARGLTVAAALARARSPRRPRFRMLYVAVLAALSLATVPLLRQHLASATMRDLGPQPVTIERPFHQARGNRLELAYYAPMERGSLSCWDAYPVPESPLLQGDLPAEERLEDARAGHVTERSWSPNHIDLDVDLERPARLLVNQNWHRGWRTSAGEVGSSRGLLVVDLPAGARSVSLDFVPRSARGGLFVSIVTLLGALLVLRRQTASHLVLDLVAAAPVVAFAAALLLFRDSSVAAFVPVAPTGERIVVDTLPAGARPLDTRFESGVTLVGASIETKAARAGSTVVLELDWMREASLEAGLGIFVHIDPSKGDALSGDHVELSQTLLLDAAPPGKILRDLLPITLPKDAGKKEWKVSVGLWRVLRGGSRVRIVQRGSATVAGDQVVITSFDVR